MPTILAVDDDRAVLHLVRRAFDDTSTEVLTAENVTDALSIIDEQHPDALLLDILLPEINGLEAYRKVVALDSKLPVIFITADDASDTAIEAMKLGALDYLLKPLDIGRLRDVVAQALEMRRLMHVPVDMAEDPAGGTSSDQFIGRSGPMRDVFKSIGRVAPQNVTVLIRGESGTGKELVARAIYHHSDRSEGPFLAVNCAALPETLLDSELFGHEKGAFTGAHSRRIGKFEQCSGGTIFLDEVGDMSPVVQGKVLRLLQEQRFERIGGNETIHTDVRVIAATNRNLEALGKSGEFREDLYYRLNGYTIHLPPLRDRGEDVQTLLQHFLAKFNRELGRSVQRFSPEALAMLTSYPWPGNVRELQTLLKQTMLDAPGPILMPEFLPDEIREPHKHAPGTNNQAAQSTGDRLAQFVADRFAANSESVYAETLEMMERYLLTESLQRTGGNQSQASRILGITRGSLRNKLRALGISVEQIVNVEGEDDDDSDE